KENVDTVEVNAVKVAPGEEVAKDQPLLEVQADKAALDVPSPVAGRVTEVRVKPGDHIKIGQVYCLIETTNGEQAGKAAAKPEAPAAKKAPAGQEVEETKEPTGAEQKAVKKAVDAAGPPPRHEAPPPAARPQPPAH